MFADSFVRIALETNAGSNIAFLSPTLNSNCFHSPVETRQAGKGRLGLLHYSTPMANASIISLNAEEQNSTAFTGGILY